MKKYKITFGNIIACCWGEVLLLVIMLGTAYLGYIQLNVNNSIDFPLEKKIIIILITLFFIVVVGIYPLIVYRNYYLFDKDVILTINNKNGELIYRNGKKGQSIKIEDILCVNRFISNRKMMNMYYYEIILKDDSKIVITNLLISDLSSQLKGIPFKLMYPKTMLLMRKSSDSDRGI